jgi:hypothetical protein
MAETTVPLKIFHCGVSYLTHNPDTNKKDRHHISGFMIARDSEHCKQIARCYWIKGKIEWCDQAEWEKTCGTTQPWLNVRLA